MPKGYPNNPELARKRRSDSHKKLIRKDSWYMNVRRAIIKRNKSKINRDKVSKSLMGHGFSEETLKKMRENHKDISGKNNPRWKGGWYIHKYKYIYSPEHPLRNLKGYVREHLYVLYKYLGERINKSNIIHHINGKKIDNRVNNLMVMKDHGAHRRMHCNKNKEGDIIFDGRKINER